MDADENGLSAINHGVDEGAKLQEIGYQYLNGTQAAKYALNSVNLLSKHPTDYAIRQTQVLNGISEELASLAKGTIDTGFKDIRSYEHLGATGQCMCPVTLGDNVSFLHSYLYGTENYQPSNVVLKSSEEIQKLIEKHKK